MEMILKQLPLVQRIRCRRVNKKWLFVLDNLFPRSLVICSLKLQPNTAKWPCSNEPVKLDNLLAKIDFSSCIETVLGMRMFNKLERLYFTSYVPLTSSQAEKCLNRLVALKVLKVSIENRGSVSSPCKLSLPRLESLKIHGFCEEPSTGGLTLDTPNLKRIEPCCWSLSQLTFLYPEKIDYIQNIPSGCDLSHLINLSTVHLVNLRKIETSPLINLANLKELNFPSCEEFKNFDFMSRERLLAFAERVKRLSNNKKLEIIYGGFRLNEQLKDCSIIRKAPITSSTKIISVLIWKIWIISPTHCLLSGCPSTTAVSTI